MEKECKEIVTRSRRRLSVDADDVSSPTAPVTPSKKRGGRFTAKPVLENIDENAPVNSPRTTRRQSAVKNIAEEEKAVTPSKRNTRIRSNTSITLENTQTFDSPRARRVARRNSLAGSDAEGPLTPARQTRKPRRDSTSSVENTEVTKPMVQISEEIIKEEPEIVKPSNDSLSQNSSPNCLRKSQRIAAKKDRNSLNKSDSDQFSSPRNTRKSRDAEDPNKLNTEDSISSKINDPGKSSPKTLEIIKNLDEKPHIDSSSRRRTKSLTNESSSDSKQNDKNKGNRSYTKISKINNVSSDGIDSKTPLEDKSTKVIEEKNIETTLNTSSNKSKNNIQPKPLLSSGKLFIEPVDNEEQSSSSIAETPQGLSNKLSENIKIVIEDSGQKTDCIENHINNTVQNHDLAAGIDVVDEDDQCVPVVNGKINSPEQQPKQDNELTKQNFANLALNKSRDKKSSINDSCEPMDIDETMPENAFLDNSDEISPVSETNENNNSLSCSVSKGDIKISDNSLIQVEEKSQISKNTSISEVSNVIDTYSSRIDTLEKSYDSSKSRIPKNTIVSEDNNDIFINTSDKSMSRRKSKTPSISENHKVEVSPNNSINTTTQDSTSISENNKSIDSLTSSGTNNQSINKWIFQLKDEDELKKFKNSSILENKSPHKSRNKSDSLEQSSNENKTTLILSHLKNESLTSVTDNIDNNTSLKNNIKDSTSNMSHSCKSKVSFSKDTPLKNKSVQNVGMQTSTPVISIDNLKSKNVNLSKNVSLQLNNSTKYDSSSSSDENNSDEDDSEKDSNENSLLDNEAEDDGDGYESGDSQTEFDKQNAHENEIVERGETLTSDEDISNNTEYEKGSFVVSSNEDDYELLSGSGNNLSMSDNELTMSAKSKKKFNMRKVKEQKRASREMFEARNGKKGITKSSSDDEDSMPILKKKHRKLDSKLLLDDSVITTKKNKQRLDSSSFVSEEDYVIKPKKNKFRLNSSGLDTLKSNVEESIITIKNTSNQILDDTVIDENEITIVNQSLNDKKDPLTSAIKLETITPQKLNISTVNISVRPDVEEIQVRENSTIWNNDKTFDPLQDTSAIDNEDSSSENEEIMQNYDSVLNELNNQSHNKKKIIKNHDTSFNLNKKNKLKADPLIDRLNLTQTKKDKKYKTSKALEDNTTNKNVDEINDESSSDLIDVKLLFPDDSDENVSKNEDSEKDFIPLKRTEGKINLQESIDTGDKCVSPAPTNKKNRKLSESKDEEQNKNFSLNKTPNNTNKKNNLSVSFNENYLGISNIVTPISKKKKSKKTSESSMYNDTEQADSAQPETSLLKTPGNNKKKHEKVSVTLNDSETDKPLNESAKKKKRLSDSFTAEATFESSSKDASTKKRKSKSSVTEEVIDDTGDKSVSPVPTNKKNRKLLESKDEEQNKNNSLNKTPNSTNKNNNLSVSVNENYLGISNIATPTNKKNKSKKTSESSMCNDTEQADSVQPETSLLKTPGNNKKKHEKVSVTLNDSETDKPLNESAKKKKRISDSFTAEATFESSSKDASTKKRKSKSSVTEEVIDDTGDKSVSPVPTNKNNRKLLESKDEEQNKNNSLNKTPNSTNKNNNLSVSVNENYLGISNIATPTNKKNKSKKTSESSMCNDTEQADSAQPETSLLKTPGNNKKKHEEVSVTLNDSETDKPLNESAKKKKRISDSFTAEATLESSSKDASTKKRKRKSSVTDEIIDDNMQQIQSLTGGSHKKKHKSTSNQEEIDLVAVQTEVVEPVGSSERNKKKKHRFPKDTDNVPDISKPKSKKRKEREDDESSKETKVLKGNYFDSLHVSRLPNEILEQLNEEPKSKKQKVVSTSAFNVVEIVKRKNKPSHYLEESVYLNLDSPEKMQKKLKDKPKVLPFIPTASTSGCGFTTKFKASIISQDIKFVAQANDIPNFKKDYIKSKMKKKSHAKYTKHQNVRMSKF